MGEVKTNIVMLYASPYRMADGGQINEGVSVSYLYGDNLAAVTNADGSMGQRPAKAVLPRSNWEDGHFVMVPGIYEGVFTMAVSKDGKPTLRLIDVNYISECTVERVGKGKPQIQAASSTTK